MDKNPNNNQDIPPIIVEASSTKKQPPQSRGFSIVLQILGGFLVAWGLMTGAGGMEEEQRHGGVLSAALRNTMGIETSDAGAYYLVAIIFIVVGVALFFWGR